MKLEVYEALKTFEEAAFVQRYENDELQETLDFAEWVGEYRLLERLREKAETLQNIHIEN